MVMMSSDTNLKSLLFLAQRGGKLTVQEENDQRVPIGFQNYSRRSANKHLTHIRSSTPSANRVCTALVLSMNFALVLSEMKLPCVYRACATHPRTAYHREYLILSSVPWLRLAERRGIIMAMDESGHAKYQVLYKPDRLHRG